MVWHFFRYQCEHAHRWFRVIQLLCYGLDWIIIWIEKNFFGKNKHSQRVWVWIFRVTCMQFTWIISHSRNEHIVLCDSRMHNIVDFKLNKLFYTRLFVLNVISFITNLSFYFISSFNAAASLFLRFASSFRSSFSSSSREGKRRKQLAIKSFILHIRHCLRTSSLSQSSQVTV